MEIWTRRPGPPCQPARAAALPVGCGARNRDESAQCPAPAGGLGYLESCVLLFRSW
jgi:hypothetical protein